MNITKFLAILLIVGMSFSTMAQASQTEQVKALNNYVQFTNESIHGLLIVHRLLENFNQEVNKYVDLQNDQLNFYGNSDLPKEIFVDPDNWFYEKSPYDWYNVAVKESSNLATSDAILLNGSLEKLKAVIDEINTIRFEIEDLIATNDLSLTQNQAKIYIKLERCVDLFDNFYAGKEALFSDLNTVHAKNITIKDTKFNTQIAGFKNIHQTIESIMESLHFGMTREIPDLNTNLKVQISALQATPIRNRHYDAVLTAAIEIQNFTQKFIDIPDFQEKYALYGKAYFYHNVELASSFNRYGSGLVKNINAFIALANPTQLSVIEEPHYYKVIYPKKEINIPNQEKIIKALPAKLDNRNVVVRQQKIAVDEKKLLLEIYDNKQEDGDIISLNFNGNWIVKDRTLEKRPMKILVDLNEEGENYLILHAKNLGDVPPNTIAVRYYFQGVRKTIVLNSDLDESEMIRLEYQN